MSICKAPLSDSKALLAQVSAVTNKCLTEFCIWLPIFLGGCPSFLPSLPTCLMHYIGCLSLSGYRIVSLQWSPVVSFAAFPPYLCDLCRLLAPSVSFGSASRAALCCEW